MAWTCSGCGEELDPKTPPFACPRRGDDDVDHVLRRVDPPQAPADPGAASPFLRWRRRLFAWEAAQAGGMSDADFVARAEALDARVAAVSATGRGFEVTPCAPFEVEGCRVWVKDETRAVGGSHKARHLMGVALYLEVAEELGWLERGATLAIASCGNAALAAAVVARAAERPLRVFIPPDARPAVIERLRELEARIEVCERSEGQLGDPTYAAFQGAVAEGALPFCCQGPDCGLTIDGGRTLAWELEEAVAAAGESLDRVFLQVGGGAMMSAVAQGLTGAAKLHAVQTEGCHPLARAWERAAGQDLAEARRSRSRFMTPWETTPHSIAHGILDDETYDWAACVEGMRRTGGGPIVIADGWVERAVAAGREGGFSAAAVSPTGAAGLAGFLAARERGDVQPGETVAVIFSGVERRAAG